MPGLALRLASRASWLPWTLARPPKWRFPRYTAPERRWLVLHSGPNPSTDYYILPRALRKNLELQVCDIEHESPMAVADWDGAQVVVVRYLNPAWAQALRAQRTRLAGVAYFMDDDLLDPSAWHGLPAAYRAKLTRHWAEGRAALAEMTSELWVATEELARRHAWLRPRVMPPLPLMQDQTAPPAVPPVGPDQPLHFFYHGTSVHDDEMRWLKPVVAGVLEAVPQAHFEIVGPHQVNRLYRDLPRTTVLHPMNWANYLAHCRGRPAHLGLAPLLDNRFNRTRSHTKVLDIARRGAVGLFSRLPPYEGAVRDGEDGLLIANSSEKWVEVVSQLLCDPARLQALRQGSVARHCAPAPSPFNLDVPSP